MKQDLRATRERIQSDVVKEILRAVFPADDPHLLAKAAFKRRKKMKCPQMADYLDILTEFCTLNKVNNAREIRPEHIEEMFEKFFLIFVILIFQAKCEGIIRFRLSGFTFFAHCKISIIFGQPDSIIQNFAS